MKIVYILEQFYLHGGGEKVTCAKVNWLSKNGFDVTLISNKQNNKKHIYPLNKNIKFIDLGVNYKKGTSYFHPKHLTLVPKHIIKLYKILSKIKPDIVVTLSLQFDYYFLPFMTKAKTIREFHSSRYYYEINRSKTKSVFKKFKYKIADFIEQKFTYNVVLTKDELKHYRSKNVIIIPNFTVDTTSSIASLDSKIVIAAGRIAPVKNFEALLTIWEHISTRKPDWKLAIYGDGEKEYKKKLLKKVNDLKIETSCHFYGAVSNLSNKMNNAAIYAMTSHTECFPMVLLEAQQVGLPIVSFDCPYGPRNIIKNKEDGFLVENKNNDNFVKSLEKLMMDVNLRKKMGEKALKNSAQKNIEVIMKKWVTLFNE